MKLTINNQPIFLPNDPQISLEKSNPALNDDSGSFSYPFAVPAPPNLQRLGWPGRLQRIGDIADKSFILEEQGIQVLQGEIEYDEITADEIGIVLKSGMTEFYAKMDGKTLQDIDFGYEEWLPAEVTAAQIDAKLAEWDARNSEDDAPFIAAMFAVNALTSGRENINTGGVEDGWGTLSPQFKIWWIIEQILEQAGYTIVVNDFKTSSIGADAVLFGNILTYVIFPFGTLECTFRPNAEHLYYNTLMPTVSITDFIENIQSLYCIMFDIDERKKEVSIVFRKDIFLDENLSKLPIKEMAGWAHSEKNAADGYSLKYQSQYDELDTRWDYSILQTVTELPAPTAEGDVYRLQIFPFSNYYRDYIVVKNSGSVLEWQRIGRLKDYRQGNGEQETEIKVTVPSNATDTGFNDYIPYLPISRTVWTESFITTLSGLVVSIYRGIISPGPLSYALISAEEIHIDSLYPAIPIILTQNLTPNYLNSEVYSDWLAWRANARSFTKYIMLSLSELVQLSWRKRYVVSGIQIMLDKIKYDIPHRGMVKIEGYTA